MGIFENLMIFDVEINRQYNVKIISISSKAIFKAIMDISNLQKNAWNRYASFNFL